MPSDFNFYLCNVNEKLSSIFVDLSLRRDAPDPYRNLLLWIWVTMNFPRPDGLSDGSEMPKLSQIEDELSAALTPLDAVFAGRITGDNRREFYFYLQSSSEPKSAVRSTMKAHPEYKFTSGSQEDSSWQQYLGLLCPSDEQMQAISNRNTLEAMREQGDTLTIPREVNHWIYFNNDAERESFSQAAVAAGYSIDSESSFETPKEQLSYGLRLHQTQPIDQGAIDVTTLELFRLSRQFNAEYDGWESEAIPENPPLESPHSIQ
jgi:regulator of RNase E activity RraB